MVMMMLTLTYTVFVCVSFSNVNKTYFFGIGSRCAQALERHEEELAAFCELSDQVSTFAQYVDQVRNSAEWGGHLELRALSMALARPIHVYSVQQGKDPLIIIHQQQQEEDQEQETEEINSNNNHADVRPIRLSYHLHYYALGEHYNQVVPMTTTAT
jgi:hypothetical protein